LNTHPIRIILEIGESLTLQLNWQDLITENIPTELAKQSLAEWSWLVGGQCAPLFLSKFGDWFLRRPDGSTQLLDVLEGNLSTIAATPDEFQALVNNREWQEERLLSQLIYNLHAKGVIPEAGQCYGFAPHPALSGRIDSNDVILIDVRVWQSICSQVFSEQTIDRSE